MRKESDWYGSDGAYDFDARIYDSRLMRWSATDPKGFKYPFHSPYSAMGNNPIFFGDKGGEEIIIEVTYDPQTNRPTYKITLTGAISYEYMNIPRSQARKEKYAESLNKELEKFYTRKYAGFDVEFVSDMKLVASKEQIKESDHVIYVINLHNDDNFKGVGEDAQGFVNNIGGKSAYFPDVIGSIRQIHEVGHWLGLFHPIDFVMTFRTFFTNAYVEPQSFLFNNFSADNLMHNPSDFEAHFGQPMYKFYGKDKEFVPTRQNIEQNQMEWIFFMYFGGLLNQGSNSMNAKDIKSGKGDTTNQTKNKAIEKIKQNKEKPPKKGNNPKFKS